MPTDGYDEAGGGFVKDPTTGEIHASESMGNAARGAKADASGGFIGGMGGPLVMILTIGPVIAAAIAGFLFGLLFKLRTFGRTIQSIMVGLPLGIVFSIAVLAGLQVLMPVLSKTPEIKTLAHIILFIIMGMITLLYFYSWYPIFKSMGTLQFTILIKKTFSFVWFGFLASFIIGFINKSAGSIIIVVSFIAGFIYFLAKVKPYNEEAKEVKAELPKAVIAALFSVAVVWGLWGGFLLFGDIAGKAFDADQSEYAIAKESLPEAAARAATQQVFAVTRQKDTALYSEPVTVPSKTTYLKKGEQVRLTGEAVITPESGTYYPVEYNGTKGYIKEYFLIPSE